MAFRPLLVIVLALLAVAWPAVADDGDPSTSSGGASAPSPGPAFASAPIDPSTDPWDKVTAEWQAFVDAVKAQTSIDLSFTGQLLCRVVDADPSAQPGSMVKVDPDGCFSTFIRRSIGWAPSSPQMRYHLPYDVPYEDPFEMQW